MLNTGLAGDHLTPPVIVHVASRVTLPDTEATLGNVFTAAGYHTHLTGMLYFMFYIYIYKYIYIYIYIYL